MYGPTPTYGGNMAVIDNEGILWSGSGAIDGSLLWLDTNNVASFGTVAITHSANTLALDMDGAKAFFSTEIVHRNWGDFLYVVYQIVQYLY
jgi:hypothetical protein